jgi:hypothetical protein
MSETKEIRDLVPGPPVSHMINGSVSGVALDSKNQ